MKKLDDMENMKGALKNKFEDLAASPSNSLWEKIESEITPQESKKRGVVWWQWGVAASIAILIASYFTFSVTDQKHDLKIVDSSSKENTMPVISNNTKKEKSISSISRDHEITSSNTGNSINKSNDEIVITKKSPAASIVEQVTSNTGSKRNKAGVSLNKKEGRDQQVVLNVLFPLGVRIPVKRSFELKSDNSIVTYSPPPLLDDQSNEEVWGMMAGVNTFGGNLGLSQKKDMADLEIASNYSGNTNSSFSSKSDWSDELPPEMIALNSSSNQSFFISPPDFQVIAEDDTSTYHYSYHLFGENIYATGHVEGTQSEYYSYITPFWAPDYKLPINFNLSSYNQFSKRWAVDYGLSYSLLRAEAFRSIADGSTIALSSKLNYVGISSGLSYRLLQKKKIGVFSSLGTALEKGLRYNYKIKHYINDQFIDGYNDKGWIDGKGFQLSLNTGIGMDYYYADNIMFYLQPGATFTLIPHKNPLNVKANHRAWYQLQAGVRFVFKKINGDDNV